MSVQRADEISKVEPKVRMLHSQFAGAEQL